MNSEEEIGTKDSPHSVAGLLNKLSYVIKETFGEEIWVMGEIQNFGESSAGHCYFSLCEEVEEPGDMPQHIINIALFRGHRENVFSQLQLEDNLPVKIFGKFDIYKPKGQVQLVMTDIDASHTTSKKTQQKEELLRELKEKGLLDLNAQKELSPLPLKIALVTSENSAAHKDFEDELKKSGFGWEVLLAHTSVQGATAPEEICSALQLAAAQKPDAIALIRGGGSAMDLAAFDDKKVAMTITQMPVPVFSGIGHEIDVSVADLTAHTHTKTPTACAAALVNLVASAEENVGDLSNSLLTNVEKCIATSNQNLTQLASRISHAPKEILSSAKSAISSQKANLLTHSTHLLEQEQSAITSFKTQIKALDPARSFARGWSITHTIAGDLVRTPKAAPSGTELVTQVKGGKIKSKVK